MGGKTVEVCLKFLEVILAQLCECTIVVWDDSGSSLAIVDTRNLTEVFSLVQDSNLFLLVTRIKLIFYKHCTTSFSYKVHVWDFFELFLDNDFFLRYGQFDFKLSQKLFVGFFCDLFFRLSLGIFLCIIRYENFKNFILWCDHWEKIGWANDTETRLYTLHEIFELLLTI